MGYSGEAAFHVMAESMSARTVGWRFSAVPGSGLALVAVFACTVLACNVDDSSAAGATAVSDTAASDPVGAETRLGAPRSEPERVVQRMEPARASLTAPNVGGDTAASSIPPSAPPGGSSRASVGQPGPTGAGALTAANAPRQVETISPKHLEAELNRLEAEIGN